MVDDDDDNFTYHVKQQPAGKINMDQINTAQINEAAHSLITKERMQKLDLLIHLLSNLKQALVVCGPEGIGKTTLLEVLLKRKTESWRYCLIQGTADLSFEAIHGQLTQYITDTQIKSLSTAFKQYENQHKQVVLIIDNAGQLVPGLIAAIIQYAAVNPVLRVVFALTHDELQVKRGSDRVVDDCHIVEIPPLSERQCGDFLQHLSTKPYANLSFKVINENMIAHIYRDTHGVPGRIITEISGSSVAKPSGKLKWILVFAVAAAIAIAVVVQWLASSAMVPDIAQPAAPVEQKADNIEMAPSLPESEVMPTLTAVQPVIESQLQSIPANEVKNAIELPVEANTNKDDLLSVISAVKPDAASMTVTKQSENKPFAAVPQKITELPIPEKLETKFLPEQVSVVQVEQKPSSKQSVAAQQKIAESLVASQEKPKQPELIKAVNDVKPPIPEKLVVKAQSKSVSAVGFEQKLNNKSSSGEEQNMAERLWAKREELKKIELSKTVKSIEPFIPNKLETISTAQTPVEIAAAPKEPVIEAAVPAPPQLEPSRIGSLPVATLPTPRDGGSAANGREPLPPPSLAVEASLAQSDNNFTLQLMVLSKQSSADKMLKKHPAMEPDIRVIKTIAKGKEKFILEYGSYSDAGSADKARQSLPFEFHNALVRKQR